MAEVICRSGKIVSLSGGVLEFGSLDGVERVILLFERLIRVDWRC